CLNYFSTFFCEFSSIPTNLKEIDSEKIYEAIVLFIWQCDPSVRIGYQTLLYGQSNELRNIFIGLIEKLPKDSSSTTTNSGLLKFKSYNHIMNGINFRPKPKPLVKAVDKTKLQNIELNNESVYVEKDEILENDEISNGDAGQALYSAILMEQIKIHQSLLERKSALFKEV
ncbi:unnamed protein product, partial [Dracunculus medinensis]|uniref:CCDC22 N-terminal domain-containing protein n=1 Tax=Dracunculus medinensis TaxID=318479 RepID=A0A0N4U9M6_DRAME